MNILSISKFRAIVAALALVFAATITAPAAHAQHSANAVKVNVPFAFIVNNEAMPAGQYTISEVNDLVLQVRGASHSAFIMAKDGDNSAAPSQGKIVFKHYGDQYFLHAVARKGASAYKQCIESKAESQARKSTLAASQARGGGDQVALVEVPK